MENKKIKNASQSTYKDIIFKSRLEVSCYKLLEKTNLSFTYEGEKISLWEGIKLRDTIVYCPNKKSRGNYGRELVKQTRALLDITYTPDFKIIKGNRVIYIDVKGMTNDTYPIKKKMFLKYLEEKNDNNTYYFFEPHSVRQIKETIDFIEKL